MYTSSDGPFEAWQIHLNYRGPFTTEGIDSNLSLGKKPKPRIGSGQVLVRMKAASLNFRDLLVATADARYLGAPINDGLSPLCDGAGVVVEMSSEDSKWQSGDQVVFASNASWKSGLGQEALDNSLGLGSQSTDGVLQQLVVVKEDAISAMPQNLSYEEAACLSGPFTTAWNALFSGPMVLRPNHTLVTQGTGAVSVAALQIAKAFGARVICLTSSKSKEKILNDLGASHVINSTTSPSWADDVLKLTDGIGADNVVEVIGAATIKESLRSVRQAGLVTAVGYLSASEQHDLVPDIIFGAKTVRGLIYGSLDMLHEMSKFVEEHNIHPVIGETYDWERAKAAYKSMMQQKQFGRIVIRIS